ncbi:MAG: OPT/YSL family transporter [Gammaproteobacteria bacterium]|nr:OPT/YSL family transporter [Gammaproteobacteria bacterium]MDH3759302.1 OPT/YSL family transporter [Gammaproteobacteria bacterium]MDH3848946.1 OPT/YSL family transporter [Gammaproteobacteria bacterium]MDH3862773.1 OPT/YSL family transporter [Gammaproteobacteria bacterium]MDH3905395.1 OPT/YSL family transporter [Gammaproteobacteria bacterium]
MTDSTIAAHADKPYPELTWIAVGVGWFLGVIIAVSIGYAALILGFSIEGSELAAILGFGILRGILRRRSIIENNIVQTVASGVNGASSGMMFSVPAIFLLGYGDRFDPVILTFGCIAGAFLGIAFIIPLRKHMIDYERLTYPGGVAVATILKSPGAGVRKAIILVGAALVSATVHVITLKTGVSNWNLGALIGLPEYMNGIWYLSLMTIGVGFIAGRGGIAFIIGGFVAYWFVSPLLSVTGAFPLNEAGQLIDTPGDLRLLLYRPLGIGMLIGGAIMGVILAAPLILSAIKSMQKAASVETSVATEEMPIKLLYFAVIGAAVLLGVMAVVAVESMTLMGGVAMALLGTLWIWMAGIILSEAIGRTNWSPLSGMTLVGITLLIIVTQAFGMERADSIIAAIMVGAAMCVAMSQATDLMLDLKTGYLVGATPRMQQIGQFAGAWLGPIVVIFVIFALNEAYTLGSERLPAPQAQALASTIDGIMGGDVPVQKYAAGAILGGILSIVMGGLGITVGLGFYLPFNIVLTYSLGTLSRELADRFKGKTWAEQVGIPVAAGLIVGEALVGVGDAILAVLTAT